MAYFEKETEFTENFVAGFLNECGISARRNNIECETNVDILTDGGIKIDAQYSDNFAQWGDLRLDIVSAFMPKIIHADKNYVWNKNLNILRNFEFKYNCTVLKPGKIMPSGYLDFLAVIFYDHKFERKKPDRLMIISRNDLISYIRPRVEDLFAKIKINNKPGLSDCHGSAFMPINAANLALQSRCVFGSMEELKKDDVRAYFARKDAAARERNNVD